MRAWRRSPSVALVAISIFAAIQLAIPISRLGYEGTYRFGWQMFSTYSPRVEFTVHTAEESEPVDLFEITARLRADLDLPSLIPPFVCERIEDAKRVTWQEESYECSNG